MKEIGAICSSSKVTNSQQSLFTSNSRSNALFSACPDLKAVYDPSIGLPKRCRSPIASKALCITNSFDCLKPPLFKIFESSKTIALSNPPPKANPFSLRATTSLKKPNVLARAISSEKEVVSKFIETLWPVSFTAGCEKSITKFSF